MQLKKACDLQVEHYGLDGKIRVDENGYIRLNDLNKYFPNKFIDDWKILKSTKELVEAVSIFLTPEESRELKPIISKTGRHHSGTYAHELVAMDFAAWLSVEFKLKVYQSYLSGTQTKKDWNFKRELSASNFKMMCDAIEGAHEEPKPYHYSNEALMINEIIFGVREGKLRDTADELTLDKISALEGHNATFIMLGMDYQSRKIKLKEFLDNGLILINDKKEVYRG